MKSILTALTVLTLILLAGCTHREPLLTIPGSSPRSPESTISGQAVTPAEHQLAREMICKITRILTVAKVTANMRTFAKSDDFRKLSDSLGRRSLQKAFESARVAIDQLGPFTLTDVNVVIGGQTAAIEACVYYKLEECRDVRIKLEAIQNLSGCGGELWGDLSEQEKEFRARERGTKR